MAKFKPYIGMRFTLTETDHKNYIYTVTDHYQYNSYNITLFNIKTNEYEEHSTWDFSSRPFELIILPNCIEDGGIVYA